jgi:hypothetical protein
MDPNLTDNTQNCQIWYVKLVTDEHGEKSLIAD